MRLRASRVRAGWACVLGVLIGASAWVFGVLTSTGQNLEDEILGASQYQTAAAAPLGLVSTTSLVIAALVITAFAWLRWDFARAVRVLVAPAVAVLASQVLKLAVLERPQLLDVFWANSFPSGHTTVYAVVFGALIWAVGPAFRGVAAVLGTAVVGTVGAQVLAYGWHRPSDVIGALGLTLAVFGVVAWIAPLSQKRIGTLTRPKYSARFLRLVMVIAFGVAVVALLLGNVREDASQLLFGGQALCFAAAALLSRELLQLTVVD